MKLRTKWSKWLVQVSQLVSSILSVKCCRVHLVTQIFYHAILSLLPALQYHITFISYTHLTFKLTTGSSPLEHVFYLWFFWSICIYCLPYIATPCFSTFLVLICCWTYSWLLIVLKYALFSFLDCRFIMDRSFSFYFFWPQCLVQKSRNWSNFYTYIVYSQHYAPKMVFQSCSVDARYPTVACHCRNVSKNVR